MVLQYRDVGGGPMIDLGVHILDLTRYLMGNPKPVSVFGATFNKLGDRPGRSQTDRRLSLRGQQRYL